MKTQSLWTVKAISHNTGVFDPVQVVAESEEEAIGVFVKKWMGSAGRVSLKSVNAEKTGTVVTR